VSAGAGGGFPVDTESPDPLQPTRPALTTAIIHADRARARERFKKVSIESSQDEVKALAGQQRGSLVPG
jgi:hypothetical protein